MRDPTNRACAFPDAQAVVKRLQESAVRIRILDTGRLGKWTRRHSSWFESQEWRKPCEGSGGGHRVVFQARTGVQMIIPHQIHAMYSICKILERRQVARNSWSSFWKFGLSLSPSAISVGSHAKDRSGREDNGKFRSLAASATLPLIRMTWLPSLPLDELRGP